MGDIEVIAASKGRNRAMWSVLIRLHLGSTAVAQP